MTSKIEEKQKNPKIEENQSKNRNDFQNRRKSKKIEEILKNRRDSQVTFILRILNFLRFFFEFFLDF